MSEKLQGPFQLGAWEVVPALDTISRGSQKQKLEPRMMRLLICLAESPGTVISQERLLAEVWSGVVVGPASVYQAVSQLRRLLGDTDPEPTYIATVPRKGYRLVAPVRFSTAPAAALTAPQPSELDGSPRVSSPSAAPSLARSHRRRRWIGVMAACGIAALGLSVWLGRSALLRSLPLGDHSDSIVVLPFIDYSEDTSDQPFCDGLTEELSNWLAQIPTLHVVARTSAFSFRGLNEDVRAIGQTLGATHVLEGSMRRSGDHMRVTVQLIDARSGYHLWSSEYDRPFEDAIRIQEDIARSVADSLEIRLTEDTAQRFAARRSDNPEAYRLYLLARHDQQDRSAAENEQAIALYRQSLEADPKFALAYVGLAYALVNEFHLNGWSMERVTQAAEPLLAKAVELEPDLSELYAVRAALREEQHSTESALSDLNRAVALNPNDSWAFAELGRLYMAQAQPRMALQDTMRAQALDPLDFMLYARRCMALQDMARFAQATAACERARVLQGNGGWAYVASMWLAASQGDLVQALNWSNPVVKADSQSVVSYEIKADLLLTLGYADEAQALYEQARAITHNDEAIDIDLSRLAFYESGADALRTHLAACNVERSEHARTLLDAAHLRLLLGEAGPALQLMTRAQQAPDFDPSRLNSPWYARTGVSDQLVLAEAELRTGDTEGGTRHLQQISDLLDRMMAAGEERFGVYTLKAQVLALNGNTAGAMQALNHAVDLGWRASWWARREPSLMSLWSRKDFQALMIRVDALNLHMRGEAKLEP